jgi:hypothetical protein
MYLGKSKWHKRMEACLARLLALSANESIIKIIYITQKKWLGKSYKCMTNYNFKQQLLRDKI